MEKIIQIPFEFFRMVWEIYWGLAFGFILSSLIRAFVSTKSITARLGRNSLISTVLSSFFGAISSSCSYAAASMSRTLLLKGATWSNAVTFMVASTNLVFEIFIVIVSLLGWSFFLGEVIGGLFFIIISSLLIAWFYPPKIENEAKINMQQRENPNTHKHSQHTHGHGSMMHDEPDKSKWVAASGHFYMDVMMVGKDILIGLGVSAVLMVLVPSSFWKSIFMSDNTAVPHLLVLAWNALVGILIAIFAFVCSVGNIVMAAVLWQGGISFGGVIAFILADLVTVPMLMVYRSYYGMKTMWFLLITLAVCIFFTALFVDIGFAAMHWLPTTHTSQMGKMNHRFKWDWQAWLNIGFIPLSIIYFLAGKRSMK